MRNTVVNLYIKKVRLGRESLTKSIRYVGISEKTIPRENLLIKPTGIK